MSMRESHPISDQDLDKWIDNAEAILSRVKGKEDIEVVFRDLTPQEKRRTLPPELELVYAVRQATCLCFYFRDILAERTGLRKELIDLRQRGGVSSPALQKKAEFIAAYAFFVMASSIVARCERMLRGKDAMKFPQLDATEIELVLGKGVDNDLGYAFTYYVNALRSRNKDGATLIQSPDDLVAITKDFWKEVVRKVQTTAKDFPPELTLLVERTTFHHGTFAVTGFQSEDRKEVKVMIWTPRQPEELVGDCDVTIITKRLCDRLALYDPIQRKNPIQEFGGLIDSLLFDGPPGTGKTSRMQMMMTRLAMRAEQTEISYLFKSVAADQIKNEWYGKTAQLVGELLKAVQDPLALALLFVDDIDLLLTGDRNHTQGADLDIMKALMDFFSGTGTNYIGNYIAVAATNKPTATDDALRQRFVYRAVITGPQTLEDYADLSALELRRFAKTGLLEVGKGKYDPLKRTLPDKLAEVYAADLRTKYQGKQRGTWDDIGKLCEELRGKDPRFTGRPVRNALHVAVAQAADFEIPEDWFTNPSAFREKPWEERISMTKALYQPLTAESIMIALEHQFAVEKRYRDEAFQKRTDEITDELIVRMEAERRITHGIKQLAENKEPTKKGWFGGRP